MENINKTLNSFAKNKDFEKQQKEEFLKAKKDSDFNDLVTKLQIPDQELMKFTTKLEECSKQYAYCKKCKGIINCNTNITGYAYLPKANTGHLDFNYIACKYRKNIDKETAYLENIYLFDEPKEIKEASMANIYTEDKDRYNTIKWLNDFIKNYSPNKKGKGLYLHGSFGSGKTYLVVATFNELAKKGVKSAIVYWPEFLRDLKSSFNTDFKEKYEKIKKVPLLLIDDIGAESTSEWGRDEILGPIVQYRMQESLPTFFTSNLDITSLEEHFSITKNRASTVKARRIIERIEQLTDKIELVSKNLRR